MDLERTEQLLSEEDENIVAASRLMHDLSVIKNAAYSQNMNPILLVEVQMAVKGTLSKYQKCGFFEGETIAVSLSDRKNFKYANIMLKYSPKLNDLMGVMYKRIAESLKEEAK